MNYLHYEFNLKIDDVVEVTLDKSANVRLLDNQNFTQYKKGRKHRYYGGYVVKSPTTLSVPHAGHWNLVVDLGGYAGNVSASARVLQEAS